MGGRRWVALVMALTLLFRVSEERELKIKQEDRTYIYNHTLAKTLVEYAAAVSTSDPTELFTWTCSKCNDMTKGFVMVDLIIDVQNCLQAFVGVAHDLNAIIIAFRGTQKYSILNWIYDLLWKQLDLNYPDMPDAMVHHGFYCAYHNTSLRPGILNAVHKARDLYGDIDIMVTGHSMGGAMASFCALDLTINHGIPNILLMTFGQPRIGNFAFASNFKKYVPRTFRVTNNHDIVPHWPPYCPLFPSKTYHHFAREVWLHNVGFESLVYMVEKICDDSGEDPTCSRSVSGNSISDHVMYYGVDMQAHDRGLCAIILDKSLSKYYIDPAGSIVLSREPTVPSILKLEMEIISGSSSV